MSVAFRVALLAMTFAVPAVFGAEPKRTMTLDDFYKLKRVADPQISPDGQQVAYQVGEVDMEKNKVITSIWVAATDEKTPPRQLTTSGKRDAHPRWSPDGTRLLFESNRGGSQQLYVLDLKNGGDAKQLTSISTEASNGIWSPDGTHIAFVSAVFPEFSEMPFAESDKKNQERLDAEEKNPVKAKVFTKLFYRHWVEYVGDRRQHLFVLRRGHNDKLDGPLAPGESPKWDNRPPQDVTPGDRDAYPTSSTFSSGEDFTFTPDSKHLVFTAVPAKEEAWSTNYDLCRVSITNTSPKWETLTSDNKAADSGPRFSPDGKKLAWRSQKTAGYEADKWDILVANCTAEGTLTGPPQNWTASKDIAVGDFAWGPEGCVAFFADDGGASTLFSARGDGSVVENVPTGPGSRGGPTPRSGMMAALSFSLDGDRWAFLESEMIAPPRVRGFRVERNGGTITLRNMGRVSPQNEPLLRSLDLPEPESVSIPVEGNVKMQMWLLKPPGFDPAKKWPVVYLVHGGPQGAWENGWSWRWNPSLWAAQGYVIAMPNPRGSTGFGQKYVDEITGDWGGKCYRDLVAGLDAVAKLPYVDKDRIATAGGSFGGYMMNWFAVNDIAPRFKTMINHCSVWNFESMWGTTDELWFDEWEHGGLPWEKPGKYAEFSPHKKAGTLGKHKVPMLVIHNDLDFRCPIGQGHELFASLQRQGVPSRFVNFPDEGHWVLKPRNSRYWHEEVFAWLNKYVAPGGK